jgi:hypothetical protein
MATGKFKINYNAQKQDMDQFTNYNHKKSHELTLFKPQTQHKRPEHIYFKILTSPLIQAVEKIVNLLHRFKYVYKQRNINVLFSQCGSIQHGSAYHQK